MKQREADYYDWRAFRLFYAHAQAREAIEQRERKEADRIGLDPEAAVDALWTHARTIAQPGVWRQ